MNNIKAKEKDFTREIFNASSAPDILCGFVILIYAIFIANLSIIRWWMFIVIVIAGIIIAQFGISSITNAMICKKVNILMTKWRRQKLDQKERTELFYELHKIPLRKSFEAFMYFFVCSCLFNAAYIFILHVSLAITACSFIATLLGAYMARLLALSYSRKICSKYEEMLVSERLDDEVYDAKCIYGYSYDRCFFSYCIVPVVWSCIIILAMFVAYYFYNVPTDAGYQFGDYPGIAYSQLPKFILIIVLCLVVCAVSIYSFLHNILVSSEKLQNSMIHILKNDIFSVKPNSTDFENEFTYNIGLVNDVVVLFRGIIEDIQKIGKTMVEPVDQLTRISQTTATTSLEQSSGVKEILATMEETDNNTKEILNRITEVTDVAEDTSTMVDEGSEDLKQNLFKMDEITEANISTINGIKNLSEKIGNIWEIVKIINNIAEQTRIIAFNAELEASSAGESGRNFHIVANEIRRLAAGITSSVDKIKDRITEIQHSSDNLIITSESGTEKIREGQKLFEKLDERFGEIRKSSDFTVESAKQIKDFIYQQSSAFDQIVSTVRQISAGIDSFSEATNTVNDTAKRLKNAADNLENLHRQIIKEQ